MHLFCIWLSTLYFYKNGMTEEHVFKSTLHKIFKVIFYKWIFKLFDVWHNVRFFSMDLLPDTEKDRSVPRSTL